MATSKTHTKFLKRQIENFMIRSESENFFLPRSCLDQIFTIEAIQEAVKELRCPVTDKFGLPQDIFNHGIRLFAILVKNGEEEMIIEFRKHDSLDLEAPMDETRANQVAGKIGQLFAQRYQWEFLPYEFKQNMRDSRRVIGYDAMVLPFVGKPQRSASGAFGEVSVIKIHPSQQEFIKNKVRARIIPQRRNVGNYTQCRFR